MGDTIYSLIKLERNAGTISIGDKGTVVGPAVADVDPHLKVLSKFPGYSKNLNIRLTEISPTANMKEVETTH